MLLFNDVVLLRKLHDPVTVPDAPDPANNENGGSRLAHTNKVRGVARILLAIVSLNMGSESGYDNVCNENVKANTVWHGVNE